MEITTLHIIDHQAMVQLWATHMADTTLVTAVMVDLVDMVVMEDIIEALAVMAAAMVTQAIQTSIPITIQNHCHQTNKMSRHRHLPI